ncbi:iron chaperone [Alkalicoccus chagannorensis]|uniref:iron chaperone n=1 Tax=Alkalicoccus chagannorensis TaxID=427072 RepID=UPI000427CA2E|nr:iron chaperone [Alkalicoccus chagannorensis]
MDTHEDYLETLQPEQRSRMSEVLQWVKETYPDLTPVIKWKQPMFTNHGTFIIGFSASAKHLAAAPEPQAIDAHAEAIEAAGLNYTKQLIRFPWKKEIHYDLLRQLIDFNIEDKAGHTSFWR